MSEKTYQPETISGYLLGSLSDSETERLDELSVTNIAFAEAVLAAESELVDAYVLDDLDEEQRRQFESHYLASPRRRDNVKFAQAFQLFGERQLQPAVRQKSVASPPDTAGWLSRLKSYFGPSPSLQWGFASAALALLLVGSWLVFQNIRLRQQMLATETRNNELVQREQQLQSELEAARVGLAQSERHPSPDPDKGERAQAPEERLPGRPPSASTVFSLVLTPQLRSVQETPAITLTSDTQWIAIKLVLEPNSYSTYSIVLLGEGILHALWSSSRVSARSKNGSKTIDIRFPANLLKPGAYSLRVMGTAAKEAPEAIGEYHLRVVK